MEFSRLKYWSGYSFPSPGDLPNPGIESRCLQCRWILYHLSHKGSPRILDWVAYPLSSISFWPRNWTRVSCIAGRFFTNWVIWEAVILEPKKIKFFTISIISPSIWHGLMMDVMILVFCKLRFKLAFSLSSFTFTKRLWQSNQAVNWEQSPLYHMGDSQHA